MNLKEENQRLRIVIEEMNKELAVIEAETADIIEELTLDKDLIVARELARVVASQGIPMVPLTIEDKDSPITGGTRAEVIKYFEDRYRKGIKK